MTETANEKVEVRVLTSLMEASAKEFIKTFLTRVYPTQLKLTEVPGFNEAAELLEKGEAQFDLILFEHNASGFSLVKVFLGLGKNATFVMFSNDEATFEGVKSQPVPPEFILASDMEAALIRAFKRLSLVGKIPPLQNVDGEMYVPTNSETLLASTPLALDVFIKMGTEGRFVCLFKRDMMIELEDLEKYSKKRPDFFFVKKVDVDRVITDRIAKLNALAAQKEVPIAEAKKQFNSSIAAVRGMVNQLGFTPEAQALAKSSVAMAVKALGSKPKLSSILSELKKKEGDYLLSHSFMVGQVACALAYKLGWHSPATFLKLSLAGFMHDISLNAETLGQIESMVAAKASKQFSEAELHQVTHHTMKASEYSRQFSEIPSDVDLIIAQHHERPDGSGFPRSMHGKLISPLSALFIMAHDLVHEVFEKPETDTDAFFEAHAEEYGVGHFKKIVVGLRAANAGAAAEQKTSS